MRRYFSSFFITMILYISLIFIAIYIMNMKFSTHKITNKSEHRVKFCLSAIEPKAVVEEKTTALPPPVKEEVKIEKPKKDEPKKQVVEKVVEKKVEKRVHKEIPKIESPKEEIVQEATQTTQKSEVLNDTQTNKIDTTTTQATDKRDAQKELDNIKNRFLNDLREKIDLNKEYPKIAKSRGIEGVVEVKFTILPSGEVSAIEIISGSKIFQKAVISAIESSFPTIIPQELKIFPLDVSLKLDFRFN